MDGINNDLVEVGNMRDEDNNHRNRAIGVVNGPLPTGNNDGDRIEQLVGQVFGNDFLREEILTHVIQLDDLSVSYYNDICSIRLVQKVWMKDVSRIMTKLRKPLYRLELNKNNSLNASDYVQKHGMKILDNFIANVALSPSRIENVVPPFSLSIDPVFFQAQNHESFSNLLTGGSAAGLVELEISVPENGGSMDLIFRDRILYFPILQTISVEFFKKHEEEVEDQSAVGVHGSNAYFLPFLQSVLHGANNLRGFTFPSLAKLSVIPAGIKYLTLPSSLTRLDLVGALTSTQLEVLANNFLPNLTSLLLPIDFNFSRNLIFRILDQYKTTLRNLYFWHAGNGLKNDDIPKAATYFHLPVMTCLKKFYIQSVLAELEPELDGDLQTCLPKLKRLSLYQQTVEMLRKWTVNSCYATVTSLTVSLVDDNTPSDNINHKLSIRLEEMQTIHMAFPNVSVLEIFVTGRETCGLKYLFMEMKQLKKLTIRVRRHYQPANSYHWDSLLTGISIQMAEMLGTLNTQFWESVNSIDLKADESSLKNLNALQSLSLSAPLPKNPSELSESLIGNAAFFLAFLKMPNLETLLLEGRFMVSPLMTQIWKAEQRSIKYRRAVIKY